LAAVATVIGDRDALLAKRNLKLASRSWRRGRSSQRENSSPFHDCRASRKRASRLSGSRSPLSMLGINGRNSTAACYSWIFAGSAAYTFRAPCHPRPNLGTARGRTRICGDNGKGNWPTRADNGMCF
jgi:hypothetical protein